MRIHRVVFLFVLGVLAAGGTAWATEIVPLSPEDMGAQSVSVVRGTVGDVRSFWNARRTKIYTEVVIDVAESYKGGEASQVRLLQLGGTVDGIRVTVHGALQWLPGEEVLVFLEPYQGDAYHVAGFSQGKFQIERDARTGRVYVSRPALAELEFQGGDADAAAAQAPLTRVPLDRFLDRALGREATTQDR